MPPPSHEINPFVSRSDATQVARGYGYGHLGVHPYTPLFEPMVLLAGLAFLAFLVQTIHSIYAANAPAPNQSLLGGVVSSLVPTRTRNNENKYQDIIRAVEIYELLNKEKKNLQSEEDLYPEPYSEPSKPSSTILVPVKHDHFNSLKNNIR